MGETRGRIPVLAALALASLSVGAMLGNMDGSTPEVPVERGPGAPTTSLLETLRVHVSGMVGSPGVVDVPAESIVADVIEAAGGLRNGAVTGRLNLAALVTDGEHVVVPGPDEEPAAGTFGTGGSEGPISLSTASASDLETLPGVGPVLAERIVSFRVQSGHFDEVEDLLEVPGIGEAKLAAIRDLVKP